MGVILVLASCKLNGTYVSDFGPYQSLEFNGNATFKLHEGNDVGDRRGYGIYQIDKKKVTLIFTEPPIKNDPIITIDTFDYIEKPSSVFPELIPMNRNFINISMIDKTTQQPITGGMIHYRNVSGSYLTGASAQNNTFQTGIDKMDFPLSVKLECMEYLDCEFVLVEKKNYNIIIELISDQGYHIQSGSREFKRKQFKNRKRKSKKRFQSFGDSKQERKFYRVR